MRDKIGKSVAAREGERERESAMHTSGERRERGS